MILGANAPTQLISFVALLSAGVVTALVFALAKVLIVKRTSFLDVIIKDLLCSAVGIALFLAMVQFSYSGAVRGFHFVAFTVGVMIVKQGAKHLVKLKNKSVDVPPNVD